jgi:hypothetical protein
MNPASSSSSCSSDRARSARRRRIGASAKVWGSGWLPNIQAEAGDGRSNLSSLPKRRDDHRGACLMGAGRIVVSSTETLSEQWSLAPAAASRRRVVNM